jgi:SAM-dependent methyltransferase
MLNCHICGDSNLKELLGFEGLTGLSSDCMPLGPSHGRAACLTCRTVVTLVSEEWRDLCTNVYSKYQAYRQSAGSEDQVFTTDGFSNGRSDRVLDLWLTEVRETKGLWLDFGCGNGSFLRAVGRRLEGKRLVGMEFDTQGRAEIIRIPGVIDLVTSWDNEVVSDLGVVSMIHVLEHMENPTNLLTDAFKSLTDGGLLLVQVPHVWTNPYVILVGDHATHFDSHSLRRLVESIGFEVEWVQSDLVPGELTLVARRPHHAAQRSKRNGLGQALMAERSPANDGEIIAARAQKLVDNLVATSEWLVEQRNDQQILGILGTSIAGTWAAESIGRRHDFWVDEDRSRVGRSWLGRQVLEPQKVPNGAKVLAVLAPTKARAAAARLGASHDAFEVILPPAFGRE